MINKLPFLFALLFCLTTPFALGQDYPTVDEVDGLSVGDTVKSFSATGVDSSYFVLDEALKDGPVVVMFYRGQWCPVCSRHLKKVQDSLQLVLDQGATVVAISPEKTEYAEKMVNRTGATFNVLYDSAYLIGEQFDVVFLPKKLTRIKYNTALNANLEDVNVDGSERLPVPATFILNQDGIIVWRQFDRDYHNRASVQDILNALPKKEEK